MSDKGENEGCFLRVLYDKEIIACMTNLEIERDASNQCYDMMRYI